MHAFSSRLDYCNSLLYGVSDELLQNLQVIQNAAARMKARKFDHNLVLYEVHCLPFRQRIRFKLAMIVYKCLHGLAPPYLADDCVLVSICGQQTALEIGGHPEAPSPSISIYFVQACKIKPNKMTVEQDNKVQRIH